MKIYSIFKKNIKIVSRNFSYFVVLFICPIILILISGIMLNSINYNNVRVGVVNTGSSLNLNSIKNLNHYSSLTNCLYDLTHTKVTICIMVSDDNESYQTDVYIDNTFRVVEYYSKQFILQNLLKEKDTLLEQTSEQIVSRLSLYSSSLSKARGELNNVKNDLIKQEENLKQYKENVTRIKRDFNEVYVPMKQSEPQFRQLKDEINNNNRDLQNNITNFRSKKQGLINNLNLMQTFLSTKLNYSDYNYVVLQIEDIRNSLNELDAILTNIERTQNSTAQLGVMLNNLDSLYSNLDNMKVTLDNLDKDLDNSISRTQESRAKIESFIVKLNEATTDLDQFSKGMDTKKSYINFKTAFSIPENINNVFLIFPILVSIIITFTSLILSNMFVLKQISKPSYLREIITPTRDITFLVSDYLVNLFFIAIQGFVLFLIGFYWFGVTLNTLGFFVLAVFLTASIFIFIGMSIAYLIRNQSLSMLLSIFLLILLLILSDLLAPSVLAGPAIKLVAELNPLVILGRVLTDIFILNQGIYDFFNFILELIVFLIVTFIFAYISKKVCREKIVQ